MLNNAMLEAGTDIPFPQAQITIHQPSYTEISYIGEDALYLGAELLTFSKKMLTVEDKSVLKGKTDFDVFMSMMNDTKNTGLAQHRVYVLSVLSLIFPNHKIILRKDALALQNDNDVANVSLIDNNNFNAFRDVIKSIFCLNDKIDEEKPSYNPGGDLAEKIAAKLNKGRAAAASAKGEKEEKHISILSQYVSIISVGLQLSLYEVRKYTVYQLTEQYKRLKAKEEFDRAFGARLAGAKDIDNVKYWMEEIHP